MGDDDTFTIDELAAQARMTPRNVRAYRTKGLLPPPVRSGRESSYRSEHLRRLNEIRDLRLAGLPLKLIIEAAQRGDDLSPRGPLSQLTATLMASRDAGPQIDVSDDVIDLGDNGPAGLPAGPLIAALVHRLSGHGVNDATVLVLQMLSARSGRVLATELSERLCQDLQVAHPRQLPPPLLSDTVELAVTLTHEALTQTLSPSVR